MWLWGNGFPFKWTIWCWYHRVREKLKYIHFLTHKFNQHTLDISICVLLPCPRIHGHIHMMSAWKGIHTCGVGVRGERHAEIATRIKVTKSARQLVCSRNPLRESVVILPRQRWNPLPSPESRLPEDLFWSTRCNRNHNSLPLSFGLHSFPSFQKPRLDHGMASVCGKREYSEQC